MKISPVSVFDLHCDTILECYRQTASLYRNTLQVDLKRASAYHQVVQTFAFFIEERFEGQEAWAQFLRLHYYFERQQQKLHTKLAQFARQEPTDSTSRVLAMLSIENASPIGADLSRVALLKQLGLSMVGLVWNHDNQIGHGVHGKSLGLSSCGKQTVIELERQRLVVDISHLNDPGFFDVARIATQPFVASHSNARAVCSHKRNLTDEQISCLIQRNGLMGLTFYDLFLKQDGGATILDFLHHIEHILMLGGEKILAIGSDFDGAQMPHFIPDISGIGKVYEQVQVAFGEHIARQMFFFNASRFFGGKQHV